MSTTLTPLDLKSTIAQVAAASASDFCRTNIHHCRTRLVFPVPTTQPTKTARIELIFKTKNPVIFYCTALHYIHETRAGRRCEREVAVIVSEFTNRAESKPLKLFHFSDRLTEQQQANAKKNGSSICIILPATRNTNLLSNLRRWGNNYASATSGSLCLHYELLSEKRVKQLTVRDDGRDE